MLGGNIMSDPINPDESIDWADDQAKGQYNFRRCKAKQKKQSYSRNWQKNSTSFKQYKAAIANNPALATTRQDPIASPNWPKPKTKKELNKQLNSVNKQLAKECVKRIAAEDKANDAAKKLKATEQQLGESGYQRRRDLKSSRERDFATQANAEVMMEEARIVMEDAHQAKLEEYQVKLLLLSAQ